MPSNCFWQYFFLGRESATGIPSVTSAERHATTPRRQFTSVNTLNRILPRILYFLESLSLPTIWTSPARMDAPSSSIQGDEFLQQMLSEFPLALAIISIPALLLYFTIYTLVKDRYALSVFLSVPTLALFWLSPYAASIHCGAARALLNFASTINIYTYNILGAEVMLILGFQLVLGR